MECLLVTLATRIIGVRTIMSGLPFLGGKSDMAAWSSIIWHVSTHLIETGPAACELPRNPLYIRCNKSLRTNYIDDSSLKSRPRKISLIHLKNVNDEDVKMTRVLRGVNFNIRGNTASKLRRVEQEFQQKDKKSKTIKSDHWTGEPFIFSTTNKYAKLGW